MEQHVNTTAQTGEGQEILSAQMKTYYDKELIRNAKPRLVHDQFAQKKPIPQNRGKTVEFRKLNPFPPAKKPLEEGVTPAGQKLDWSTLSALSLIHIWPGGVEVVHQVPRPKEGKCS